MPDLNNLISLIQNSQKTLFILCGFPYAGKTYVAQQIRAQISVVFVSVDNIFYARGFDWNSNTLPGTEEWEQIFVESYRVTKQALLTENNVLYDSTNQTVVSRDKLRAVAESVGAKARVIYVESSISTVWKRWEENQQNPTRSVVSRELVQQTIGKRGQSPFV